MDERLKRIIMADKRHVESQIQDVKKKKAKNWCVSKPGYIDPTLNVQDHLPSYLGGGPNPLPLTDERSYFTHLNRVKDALTQILAGNKIPRPLLDRISAPDYLIENFSQ